MALKTYYPEMGEPKPSCQIEATLGRSGAHWYLKTRLHVCGRGIKHLRTMTAHELVSGSLDRVGLHEYRVTEAAFERLQQEYEISTACLL